MKNNNRLKLFFYLMIFFIYSIISIYSFSIYVSSDVYNLVLKQIFYYFAGFFFIITFKKIDFDKIIKYSFLIYLFNILLLIYVLFFGQSINGTKAWINIFIFGSFQPSEFMKFGLIVYLSFYINKINKLDFKSFFIITLIILIPSILTFLEPDTGAVIMYLVGSIPILFFSNLNKKLLYILILIFFAVCGAVLFLYFFNESIFINIFGNSLFYRLHRLFDWTNSSGMQLNNSLIAIGSSGLFGKGINNILIYYPEGHTDFIFTSIISVFGLLGSIFFIIITVCFDFFLLKFLHKKNNINKYIILSFISILIYQQIQNISMTLGLLPITGITLPFISSGGSSLISYMIFLALLF